LLTIILILVIIGGFVGLKTTEQKSDGTSVEQQLSEILRTQKSIEDRLTIIETKQTGMANMIQNRVIGQVSPPPSRPMPPEEDPNQVYNIDVGHSSIKGDKNGKVTIVEFSDFQCPFSGRFHPVVNQVLEAYPQGVKFIYKNYPLSFHPQAEPAARASLAAREQGKYWEMVELIFQNNQNLSEETYKRLAGELGLNVEKFMKDYEEPKIKEYIQEDTGAAQSANVRGTPTFYLNGKQTNARDLDSWKAEINAILEGK